MGRLALWKYLLPLCLFVIVVRGEDGISSYEVEMDDEASLISSTDRTLPSERGAVYGHSPIAANPKDRFMEPLSLSNSNNDYLIEPPSPTFLNSPPMDTTFRGSSPSLDPVVGLDHLDYIAELLENYPTCGDSCDVSRWKGCTCAYPATYSEDGRGNCNVGSTKPDLKVWCYVDSSRGDPLQLCPDAKNPRNLCLDTIGLGLHA
ncbi:unnamed protein product [Lepeophtheirus salmonis]|uniref:(salmon louse) hypothetical protein n=1 Tax=Lepeophtheirus salmonis TaxID=72036 RepID=A0A7R8D6C8_LEPSM|nr:unnamed protein product [Lepeophtheirus salmonis]CAF2988379.1 unnamed protein product [Lepeophtheirus salmonis]